MRRHKFVRRAQVGSTGRGDRDSQLGNPSKIVRVP